MDIGRWLRELREAKGLSHADIERRAGLLRPYVSRIDCGRTMPSLPTLDKGAKALDLDLYQFQVALSFGERLDDLVVAGT